MFYLETHSLGDGTVAGGAVKRMALESGMGTLTRNEKLFHEGNSRSFANLISKLAILFRGFYLSMGDAESLPEEFQLMFRNVVLTHDVMIKFFNDALRDSRWIEKDKLDDQFQNLPGIGGVVVTTTENSEALNSAKDAYSSRQAGGPNDSGKRSRSRTDELDLEPEPRPGPSKRSRTSYLSSKETLFG